MKVKTHCITWRLRSNQNVSRHELLQHFLNGG